MQPKKSAEDDLLERLRNSVGNVDRAAKSRATATPLDPSDEKEMGGTFLVLNVYPCDSLLTGS